MTDATRARALRVASGLLAALFVVNAAPRVGHFSGDAIIHLSIAERAAAGHWFEFNPGEVASGSTSFAWTLLESTLLRIGSMALLVWVIPAVDLAALIASGFMVRHLALKTGASRPAATLAGLVFAALPAITYNALLGMENIVHVLAALGAVALAARPVTARRDLALGAVIGVAATLRPEGVLLGALPLLALRDGTDRGAALRSLLRVAVAALAVYAPSVWVHWRLTGHVVPGSGVSRLMAVRREPLSLHLAGPLWVYLSAASRFVVYLPITALALAGARETPTTEEGRVIRRAALSLFALGLALYTFGTGAAHVGRLTQWLFALLAVLLARGVDRALSWSAGGGPRLAAVALLAALHALLCAGETVARMRDLTQIRGGWDREMILGRAARRGPETDRLLRTLCAGGCCVPGLTPTVAVVEAQLRYDYDGRVRISSLDGRTAAASGSGVLRFDARGCPELEPALAAPEVVGVMEPPLAQLARCGEGAPTARALTERWGGVAEVQGWRWTPSLPGWTRVCAR